MMTHVEKLRILREAILMMDRSKIPLVNLKVILDDYFDRINFELCFPEIPEDDAIYDLITATYYFLKGFGIDTGINPSRPT